MIPGEMRGVLPRAYVINLDAQRRLDKVQTSIIGKYSTQHYRQ